VAVAVNHFKAAAVVALAVIEQIILVLIQVDYL
jgi:hypothetical protein